MSGLLTFTIIIAIIAMMSLIFFIIMSLSNRGINPDGTLIPKEDLTSKQKTNRLLFNIGLWTSLSLSILVLIMLFAVAFTFPKPVVSTTTIVTSPSVVAPVVATPVLKV